MISSELEEFMGVADCILVMSRGEIVGGLDRPVLRERILSLAFGRPPHEEPHGQRPRTIAVRNATYLIFGAVLLWFGLQAPTFLMPESLANIVKHPPSSGSRRSA